MSDPTVLLVDDDDNILTVLSMRLRAAGYRVLTARDGDGAVAVIGQNGVDVVLSDLRLEREDGLDVMERVHALDNDLPVLILTARGSIPNDVEALASRERSRRCAGPSRAGESWRAWSA